ncbi:hypothetical protein AMAG_05508 [Allomyces macrogynus ATCC 38327]|uniref:RRM domain-containing protein n=1 Tax=Allomyces macrogynus (strain ATCC 38327) TaxID=578462 RepID=A0A0L0SCB3_ALLM3|nr:hypothetical protein AMAG_05508 [Allomyces macrogynus ATCC 38327]|eukprot:KNE60077.1 hypothetical protein AMAG_05508 [Allomyces macrogynus ATCC 38327]
MSAVRSAPGTRALTPLWASYTNRPVIFFAATTKNYANLKESSLREHFAQFGPVEDVRINKDVITHRQQKWGLVVFGDEQATTRAPGTSPAATANAFVVSETAIERALSSSASITLDGVQLAIQRGAIALKPDLNAIDHFGFTGFFAKRKPASRVPPPPFPPAGRS